MIMELPIKDIKIINIIKEYYKKSGNNRDLLFFLLSINTGLKLNEIANLNVEDVKDKDFIVVEHCTEKIKKRVPLNDEIKDLIEVVIASRNRKEPLFISGKGNRIERTTVYRNFKEMCDNLGLDNLSIASLRKTFGYHYYKKTKDLAYLQWWFNHSSITHTMNYLCIEDDLNFRYDTKFSL